MADSTQNIARPAGYLALMERFGLEATPHWHRSFVARRGVRRLEYRDGLVQETYPSSFWPGEGVGDHLEFALKHDGISLSILSMLFRVVDHDAIAAHIGARPMGKYARRLWFLFEFLTGKLLPMEDLRSGNYLDLLDSTHYYTSNPGRLSRRHRIRDNLLGDGRYCPMIRRTEALLAHEAADLPGQARQILSNYSSHVLRRALNYLYTKETKSSFEIEHITPSVSRTERFIAILHQAEHEDFCEKSRLIDVQNRIVDPRFREHDYRVSQNYVGQSLGFGNEHVHYVCPKPEHVPDLMSGLISSHHRMEQGHVPAVAHAAAISYGLVFIHPFDDGNGRIHRFLIHNILARRGFTPEGVMLPVSATMLRNSRAYDASLEAFSRPLMRMVEYQLDQVGRMEVTNDVHDWYRFPDMTAQTEALFQFIEQSIHTDLLGELTFLANHDQAKRAIQEIVDLPDRQLDLFIQFCLQNQGHLSNRKREAYFNMLDAQEIDRMEAAVGAAFAGSPLLAEGPFESDED